MNSAQAQSASIGGISISPQVKVASTPLVCDGSVDQTTQLQALFTTAEIGPAYGIVTLPTGCDLRVDGTVTATTAAGYDGNHGYIDASHSPNNTVTLILNSKSPGANFNVSAQWRNLVIYGGFTISSTSGRVGLQLGASNLNFYGVWVHGFQSGIQGAAFGYVDTIYGIDLSNNHKGLDWPNSLFDSGEKISVHDGSIYGNNYGVYGAAEFDVTNVSLDNNYIASVYMNFNAGTSRFLDDHFETFTTNTPIQIAGTGSYWAGVDLDHDVFMSDTAGNYFLISITSGGPWVVGRDIFYGGLTNTTGSSLVTGTGAAQVVLCGISSPIVTSPAPPYNISNVGTCP